MKLNKKRITILVSLMCLLVLLVFTLCSFDLPHYPDQASELLLVSGHLNSSEAEYIKTILDYQDLCGQFNSLVPLCISHSADGYISCLFALPSSTLTYSTTGQASQTRYMYELTGTQNNAFISIGFSTEGFAIYSVYSAASVSILRDNILYYRTSFSSSLVRNSRYDYDTSSSSVRTDISNVYNYWDSYVSRLSGSGSGASPEELESAYNAGYETGVETGYIIGWDEGYETGYKSGYDYGLADGYETGYGAGAVDGYAGGFADGYDTGFDDGYATGYDSGYDNGYDTGYSDGLEDAPSETVTIVIYEEPVEIDVPGIISSVSSIPDSILSGSFDFEFVGINIYGLLKLLIIVFIISAVIFFIIKRSA